MYSELRDQALRDHDENSDNSNRVIFMEFSDFAKENLYHEANATVKLKRRYGYHANLAIQNHCISWLGNHIKDDIGGKRKNYLFFLTTNSIIT